MKQSSIHLWSGYPPYIELNLDLLLDTVPFTPNRTISDLYFISKIPRW